MKIARGVESHGDIDGRLIVGEHSEEIQPGQEFLDYVGSRVGTFDNAELERIGSWAYFAAVRRVRSTTAGFVLAAADQIVAPGALISSDADHNAAFQAGVNRMRDFLARIRSQPGGTLADAAMGYVKLLAAR